MVMVHLLFASCCCCVRTYEEKQDEQHMMSVHMMRRSVPLNLSSAVSSSSRKLSEFAHLDANTFLCQLPTHFLHDALHDSLHYIHNSLHDALAT